jgi:hypothetical protein
MKMGRPALPESERVRRREESLRKARVKAKKLQRYRKKNGLCRHCGQPVCDRSIVFCEKHLSDHRRQCTGKATRYSSTKNNAKRRGVPFEITAREFNEWILKESRTCHYCGVQEQQLSEHKRNKQRRLTIDRKDNSQGYKLDNICLACFRCNSTKSNFFSYENWMKIAVEMIRPRLEEYHGMPIHKT